MVDRRLCFLNARNIVAAHYHGKVQASIYHVIRESLEVLSRGQA